MIEIPGLDAMVAFGDAEAPLPDWRERLDESEGDDSDDASPERVAEVSGMLGLDLDEVFGADGGDDDEEEEPEAKAIGGIGPSPFLSKRLTWSLKSQGTCEPGQTAARTGCTPASGEGGKKPAGPRDEARGRIAKRKKAKAERHKRAVMEKRKAIRRARKAMIAAMVKKTGDVTKEAAAAVGESVWNGLHPDAQKEIKVTVAVAKAINDKLQVPFRKGKELAMEIAKSKGCCEAQAERTGKVLGILDAVGSWVMKGAGFMLGGYTPRLASAIPLASLAYIAASGVAHPMQTMAAARRVMSGKVTSGQGDKSMQDFAGELLESFAGAEDADWLEALVAAAIDEGASPKDALRLAKEESARQPFAQRDDDPAAWALVKGEATDTEETEIKSMKIKRKWYAELRWNVRGRNVALRVESESEFDRMRDKVRRENQVEPTVVWGPSSGAYPKDRWEREARDRSLGGGRRVDRYLNAEPFRKSVGPSPFLVKRLSRIFTKAGFSGKKEDAIGRTICYDDGRRVSCGGDSKPAGKPSGSGKEGQQGKEAAKKPNAAGKKQYAPPPPGEKLTKAPCCLRDIDPAKPNPKTGMFESRIGVPAMEAPPPPKEIPRLPNLTEKERRAETRFANKYLRESKKMIAAYEKARNTVVGVSGVKSPDPVATAKAAKMAGLGVSVDVDDSGVPKGKVSLFGDPQKIAAFLDEVGLSGGTKVYKVGDAPNIFSTDDAKFLSPDYNLKKGSKEEKLAAKGEYNLATHQVANALAKRAFLDHLDKNFADLPEEKRFVLVTSGGVAAGKGFALQQSEKTKTLTDIAGAVWDAAGEQNAAENPWVLEECRKRGIPVKFAFVHADPAETWENPERGVVERANSKGRMVDARVFSDSYAYGAKNFKKFMDQNIEAPDVEFYLFDNARKKPDGKSDLPAETPSMPEKAMRVNAEALYRRASKVIEQKKGTIKPAVYRGGTIGQRVYGKPTQRGAASKPAAKKPTKKKG